jgi:hypothetical protein
MKGASAKEAAPSDSVETQGVVTCYEEVEGDDASSAVSLSLTVGESCLDSAQMVAAAGPQLYQNHLKATNASLILAATKGGTTKSFAVACARVIPKVVAKLDAPPTADNKTLKVETVVPKVRVQQILVRHWKGTGPKPTDPVKRKPVSRTIEEAEVIALGILDRLVLNSCDAFSTLCKKFSECQSALKGGDLAGDLGWLERAKDSAMKQAKEQPGNVKSVVKFDIPAAVLKAAFELKVGELSDLVPSEMGVHVLWRTG